MGRITWRLLFTLAVKVAIAVGSTAKPELYEGVCRVVTPADRSFDCRAAAFGTFLPVEASTPPLRLRVASGDMTACTEMPRDSLIRSVVLVRRGGCVFQQKLVHVAAAGGVGMVLVNTDEELLQLGTLEFESIGAFAVAVKRSEGDHLVRLVQEDPTQEVTVDIHSNLLVLEQAGQRIDYLMTINAPLVAVETFFTVLPPNTDDLDALLEYVLASQATREVTLSNPAAAPRATVEFLLRCSRAFHDQWEFERDASFHAAVAAVVVLDRGSRGDDISFVELRSEVFKTAVTKLLGAGYYAHAARLLNGLRGDETNLVTNCLAAFVHFLRGGIVNALEQSRGCDHEQAQFNITAEGLDVVHQNFLRLVVMDTRSENDKRCLAMLSSEDTTVPVETAKSSCCRRRVHGRADEFLSQGEPQGGASINRRAFWYASAFVEELHHTFNIMGVFLDELGAFAESQTFFQHVSYLCEDWSLSTEFRRALAVPIVFDSTSATVGYASQLHDRINGLKALRDKQERVLSSLVGFQHHADFYARPEDATYLRYTMTPPTMFVGYQGQDVLALQRAVFLLRAELFPSLNSRFQPLNSLYHRHEQPQRRRIAFVSAWFRNHSVGKLILGVIKRLDRSKFHVMVYRSVQFLRASDDLTKQFHREADSYMELPVDVEDALALLRHEAIDVLVFPELGMDAWTLFLSHHRIAPVQCVFWGHPITTANPAIDYFITSEFFISDFFEGDSRRSIDEDDTSLDGWPGKYHGSSFSEQVVLFRGLSTFFTNKFPSGQPVRQFKRSMLHLPATARLYVCPQTLMKLHTQFDTVLDGILTQDADARIILLSSDTQRVWKEQLRRRFRSRLGHAASRRVVFFSTLPYDEFMGLLAAADVVLDPFPFGGGVTTLDALAVGSPVVTLPSAQTVPQLAAGFLRAMGVTDTIATDVDDYVALALRIARDATLRQQLHDRILAKHTSLYEDATTLDDWNAFLAAVDVDVDMDGTVASI